MGVRVVVAPNGALELLGVDLPPGVGSGPVLTCLRGVVARVRVPAPPSARTIEHTLSLAR